MKRTIILSLLVLFGSLIETSYADEDKSRIPPPGKDIEFGEDLGTVTLPFSCKEASREQARRGLALLHHMTYAGAREAFIDLKMTDPDCAMGYWGQAMSYIHPLWSDPPEKTDFEKGKALVAEATTRARSEKEREFISAVESYYAQGRSSNESANLSAFAEGWRTVYQQFPKDPEAATFYALALMATADPEDKSYAKQKESARIARQVLERFPDHPGAHHYTIHALDYPPLAPDALAVARSYAEIAPDVPHALHMPSHIFTRLGLWEESITLNRRSADAALKHPVDGQISMHYLHGLDYLAYAYLQRGKVDKAEMVRQEMNSRQGPFQPHAAAAYAFAAVPARLVLEREKWASAAGLEARKPAEYPWNRYPAMEAITYFAKGIGAARSGDDGAAGNAIEMLATLKQKAQGSAYWMQQIEIQRLAVAAWRAYSEGRKEDALRTMRKAAEMEAATEKHPITPGEVLPAHELLGDMLFELGRYQEALASYETALQRSPNRLRSLFGAGRAAELAGNKEFAERYYSTLLETVAADAELPRIQHAQDFLGRE